ncbi:MAG: SDR family oxidoreductase [Chloroflexota bacterium]
MIVVTGANGQLGRQVVSLLREQMPVSGIAVSVREPDKAADLAAAGIDVRKADFRDRASMERAFAGADKVLVISTRSGSDVLSEHRNAVDGAVAAGVRHVVYTSGTRETLTSIGRVHERTEEAIKASGLTYTLLRNNLYADVLVREVLGAIKAGVLSSPAGEGQVAAVTRRDCAAAAAAVLATDGHQNSVYDICGSESLGWIDLAAIASEIAGRPIPYKPASPSTAREGMIAAGVPAAQADMWLEVYKAYSCGVYHVPSDSVAYLTGRPATPARAFIREAACGALAHRDRNPSRIP